MSDRLRNIPESAIKFAVTHPRATRIGALALSATIASTGIIHEGQPPLTEVKIGSYRPHIIEQLKENDGATLRGGPSTDSAPIGKAPIGERFEVTGIIENGSWVKVKLDPEENIPDICINYGQLPTNESGEAQIPTEVYISRSLVKRAPYKSSK